MSREGNGTGGKAADKRKEKFPRHTIRTAVLLVVACGLMVLDASTPPGLAIWLLQVMLVWIATLWASRTQIIVIAMACGTFIVIGSSWSGGLNWVYGSNMVLSVGAVIAIAQTSLRQRAAEEAKRRADEELAQSEEKIRILSGLLPICAWCKKIRNESNSWEILESYISSHSQAQFTHGMCPECATKVLPK